MGGGIIWMGVHGGIELNGCTWGHWMDVHGDIGWMYMGTLDGCASPMWGIGWVCVMGDIGWVYMGGIV